VVCAWAGEAAEAEEVGLLCLSSGVLGVWTGGAEDGVGLGLEG